ncbi:MAG: hypothetical protein ACTHMH_08250, partial [Curtobacterium sp.]
MSLAMRPLGAVSRSIEVVRAPKLSRVRHSGVTGIGLAGLDLTLLLVAFAVAHLVRFPGELPVGSSAAGWTEFVVAPVMIVAWMVLLTVSRSRDPRIVGVGGDEFRRLITASLVTVATVAGVAYAVQIDLARGYVAIAFPLGL